MGIEIEFNPDLALRAFGTEGRLKEECLPENLESKKIYEFLKEGQRNYWFGGEIPLCVTEGDGKLSRPIASITIIEATHFISSRYFVSSRDTGVVTRGKFFVNEVFNPDDKTVHFESYRRLRCPI